MVEFQRAFSIVDDDVQVKDGTPESVKNRTRPVTFRELMDCMQLHSVFLHDEPAELFSQLTDLYLSTRGFLLFMRESLINGYWASLVPAYAHVEVDTNVCFTRAKFRDSLEPGICRAS